MQSYNDGSGIVNEEGANNEASNPSKTTLHTKEEGTPIWSELCRPVGKDILP